MSQNQKKHLIKVIFLATIGFFILVCQDSTAKYLGTMMPLNQILWGRFFFSLCYDFNIVCNIKT